MVLFSPHYLKKSRLLRSIVCLLRKNSSKPLTKLYYEMNYYRGNTLFVSITDEVAKTHKWIKTIPKDFDMVVAIPRAGLLEATVISLELAKPLSLLDEFISDKNDDVRKIILIDDAVGTGRQMLRAEHLINTHRPDIHIIKGALLVKKNLTNLVDTYYEIYEDSTAFEHDLLEGTSDTATDLDGILCEDYRGINPYSDARYRNWILNAKPYKIPLFELRLILTGRLDKFRHETEQWLKHHNVKYRKLIMCQEKQNQLDFKSNILAKEKPYWYWESDPTQAEQIHKKTGIKVICFDTMQIYG